FAVIRVQGDTDFDRYPELRLHDPERGAEVLLDPLRDEASHFVLALNTGNHYGEAICAHAGEAARLVREAHQPRGDLPEQLVAGLAAKRVVDGLEPLDIQDEHAEPALRCARSGELLFEPFLEQGGIRQAGERVVIREKFELLRLLD